VISEIGSSEKREMLAMGETPNLAARIQGQANPDEVMISAATYRLVEGVFACEDRGQPTLKGITTPLTLYRVVKAEEVQSRFDAVVRKGLTPLVGREHEIAMLLERWQLAQDGEGQVVLLSGEPGIGKSRVLSALLEQLETEGVSEILPVPPFLKEGTHMPPLDKGAARSAGGFDNGVAGEKSSSTISLRFQCSPYHVNSAFYPIIDNLERTLKFGRDETAESKLDKLEALIVTYYGIPKHEVRFIAAILSIPCEDRYGPLVMTPQKHKDETLRSLVDLTVAIATKQPTVMLFEDAHWADPTSLEVLDLLIDRVRTSPLLIVLTHRPEFSSRWSRHGHVTTLNLSKLTRAQSRAIVSKLTNGKALPAELLEQIVAKTDGVPLFVEELTKTVMEQSVGAYCNTPLLGVPATLQDALMTRLDRLGTAKEIAQIGAVIGREFSYELLVAVATKARTDLEHALEQLTDSGLAFRRGTPPEAIYTFKHALVQDAAYDSLLKSRRQALHATIARVLKEDFPQTTATEPELLAHHLTAAGQAAAAIPFWQQAGELAIKRLALKEAIAHLNQGMTLIGTLPPSPERDGKELDLRTRLGTAWIGLKGWAASEVWTSLHPALELAKSLSRHDALLTIYWGLSEYVLVQGRVAEALDLVNEMLTTAEAKGDPFLLIVAHWEAGIAYFWRGDVAQSRTHDDTVLALYDEYNEEQRRHFADLMNTDPTSDVGVHGSLGTWMQGYPDRAVQLCDANDAYERQRGHSFDLGWVLTGGGMLWDLLREPARLLARIEEAEQLGRTHSLPFISEVLAQIMKGIAWVRAGRLTEGIPQLRRAMETYNTDGGMLWMPYYRAALAEGLALSGDLAGGLRLIEEGLTQIARPGWEERWYLAEVLRLKGAILLMQESQKSKIETDPRPLTPDPQAEAEACFLQAIGVAQQQQAKSWELRASISLARLWQQQGKYQEAYELLAPVYNWFTEGFDTKDLQEAKALLEELGKENTLIASS
jgi:predicted ATPase